MRDNTKKSLKSALLFGVGAGGGGRGEVSNDLLRADSVSYFGPDLRCDAKGEGISDLVISIDILRQVELFLNSVIALIL